MKGHRCAPRFFLLVADEDNPNEPLDPLIPCPDPDLEDQPQPEPPKAQISFYALSGQSAPKTLRLLGRIANQPVVILVDGDSTHNFIQACLVRHLDLAAQPTPPLRVLAGNGNVIDSHQLCVGATIQVQGHAFTTNLLVLPICGVDVVLGVHWLKSLGPILTDYTTLTMKFVHHGKIIKLRGDTT